ncbi:MAG: hypothetical protein A3H31_03325 [Gallionellales bacterium RIFCSPLOWO2_02_FULL_57_47]|nr:MAG: hypothetical protein A3H31_03325 [Gallionellales bacterium RIFCSPLOWO2_02_FULL_57_47]
MSEIKAKFYGNLNLNPRSDSPNMMANRFLAVHQLTLQPCSVSLKGGHYAASFAVAANQFCS